MRNYQKSLIKACHDLGLDIHIDTEIKFPSGQKMVPVHIPQLGGGNGMIIATEYDEILELQKQLGQSLPEAGYGFSVLSDYNDHYNREDTIDMFSDWGWGGSEETKPKWMKDPIDDDEVA